MVDFTHVKDNALRYIERGNHLEGAKIYRALSESIAELMYTVDDSDGHCGVEFEAALRGYMTCVLHARLDAARKREFIEYLFDRYMKNDPDIFEEHYEDAMLKVCTSEQDFTYLFQLVKPHIPKVLPDRRGDWHVFFQARSRVGLLLKILERLNRREDIYAVLEKNWKLDNELCLEYARLLEENGRVQEAVDIAENGVRRFPNHMTRHLRTFLDRHYRKGDPNKHRENLIQLFYHTNDWKYYDTLKKYVSRDAWGTLFQEMVKHFTDGGGFNAYLVIDLYIREKMHEKALNVVLPMDNLETLVKYHSKLAVKYPEKYFFAYQNLISHFVEVNMGRQYYKKAASYLKKMRSIEGFDKKFQGFINLLRQSYRNRPAFLDETKRL
jgi:hypothetical protein